MNIDVSLSRKALSSDAHEKGNPPHREQIVDAACRLFFKKGYHRRTIREIALASGMSMGQLYHNISSKDDVLFLT